MKKLLLSAAMILATSPAFAMKITNLDTVPHRVLFEAAGSKTERTIAPDATEYFVGQPSGMLSLITAPAPKPAKGTLQADGLLSGIIGAGRTENIPADSDDGFVIWPGGKIVLQQHAKSYGRNH